MQSLEALRQRAALELWLFSRRRSGTLCQLTFEPKMWNTHSYFFSGTLQHCKREEHTTLRRDQLHGYATARYGGYATLRSYPSQVIARVISIVIVIMIATVIVVVLAIVIVMAIVLVIVIAIAASHSDSNGHSGDNNNNKNSKRDTNRKTIVIVKRIVIVMVVVLVIAVVIEIISVKGLVKTIVL